jgi:phospholipid/cholesterol/gamma-HCH transport system substrate-binding protein
MYVLATLTSDNVGRTLTRVTTGTQGQEPLLTDTYLQEDTQFKFGVQYARRFGFVTLRGGLIESSAGGGMDVHAFADHVMLSADLFRFDENSRPRLRASLLVEFYKYLFAWAGGDELMYPSTRADLFYGLGVRFTDDDLKILFASAPSISTK